MNNLNIKNLISPRLIELIIALIVFFSIFYSVKCMQDSAISQFRYSLPSHPSVQLSRGLRQIRSDIERTHYPDELIKNVNNFIFRPSTAPNLLSFRNLSTSFHPTDYNDFNFFYKAGRGNQGEINHPSNNETIKLVSFLLQSPIFNNVSNSITDTKITAVNIYWQGKTNNKPYTSILYQKYSLPFDARDNTKPVELITYVDKVFIGIQENNVNITKSTQFNFQSLISITAEISIKHESIKLPNGDIQRVKFSENITAKCNVFTNSTL